jgi:hypothetical protein
MPPPWWGELGWLDRRWRQRLTCDLRPRSCRFVSLEEVADLARRLPGCQPMDVEVDEDGESLQMNVRVRGPAACGGGRASAADTLQRSHRLRLQSAPEAERRPRGGRRAVGPHAGAHPHADRFQGRRARPATFSASRPELAGWVLAELSTAACVTVKPTSVGFLYTSAVLL